MGFWPITVRNSRNLVCELLSENLCFASAWNSISICCSISLFSMQFELQHAVAFEAQPTSASSLNGFYCWQSDFQLRRCCSLLYYWQQQCINAHLHFRLLHLHFPFILCSFNNLDSLITIFFYVFILTQKWSVKKTRSANGASKYCTWEWENDKKNQHEIEFNTIFSRSFA